LGNTFDIHGGGADLVFPHHENERAQSECATGKKFVNTWMHVGFVQIDKQKMSKSLDNFFTIREVLKEYDAQVLRYFLLASHYRSPVNYSIEALTQAKSALDRLYNACRGAVISQIVAPNPDIEIFQTRFFDAMNDDFNTPIALSVLFDMTHEINSAQDKNSPSYCALVGLLKKLARILGLLQHDPEDYFQANIDEKLQIQTLIKAREDARLAKNWALADDYRQQLSSLGITLEDSAQGTLWRKR
jgi:cysteinyl-tRNA synthetase